MTKNIGSILTVVILLFVSISFGRQRDSQPVEFKKTSNNLYEIMGGRGARTGAYVGDNGVLLIDSKMGDLKAETGNSKNKFPGLGDWPDTLAQAKSLIEYGYHKRRVFEGKANVREGRTHKVLYGINKVTLALHPSTHSRLFTDKKYHGPLRSGWDGVMNPLNEAGIQVLSDEKLHLIPACETLCLYYTQETVQAALYKQVSLKRLPDVSFFDCIWWGMSEKHKLDKKSISNKQIPISYIRKNSVEAINLLVYAWKVANSSFKKIPSITSSAGTPAKDDMRAYAKNLIDNGNPIQNNLDAYTRMGIRTLKNLKELVLVIKPRYSSSSIKMSEGKLKEATQRLTRTLSQNGVRVLSTDQIEEVPGYTALFVQYIIQEPVRGEDRYIWIQVSPALYQEVLAHKKPQINYYERTWLGNGERGSLSKQFHKEDKTLAIDDVALGLLDNAVHIFLRDLKLANADLDIP